jgi:hypothetical protein
MLFFDVLLSVLFTVGSMNEFGEAGRILSQGRTSSNAWCMRECEQVFSYGGGRHSLVYNTVGCCWGLNIVYDTVRGYWSCIILRIDAVVILSLYLIVSCAILYVLSCIV